MAALVQVSPSSYWPLGFAAARVLGLNILSEKAETFGLVLYELGTGSTVCKSFTFAAK